MSLLDTLFPKELSGLKKILLFYMFYNLILVISSLSIVAFISFFHFLLEHNISVIESWLSVNVWEIIICYKIFSLVLLSKFLEVHSLNKNVLVAFLKKHCRVPNYNIFVIIIFVIVLISSHSNITSLEDNRKYFSFQFISYFGHFIFYVADFLLLSYLFDRYGVSNKKEFYLFVFWSTLIFYLSSIVSIPYVRDNSFFLVIHFMVYFFIYTFKKSNFSNPLVYLVLYLAPASAFYGLDIIWKSNYSNYQVKGNTLYLSYTAIWVVAYFYTAFVRKKRER
jgi:hypothetical protein